MIIGVVGCFSGTVAMVICCPFCTSGCMFVAVEVLVKAEPFDGARDVDDWTGLMIVMLLVARGASCVTCDRNGPVA